MNSIIDEAYRLFEDAYSHFNDKLFEGILPVCLFTYQRQAKLMGYVSFNRWVNTEGKTVDELAINPAYFANYPVSSILQTLCHEMVHIWQEYHGKASRGGYHNSEWSWKMQSVGLMPSSTGKPGGDLVGQQMSDYIIKGGAFEQACKELLESGFRLSWYDTVQIPPQPSTSNTKKTANVIPLRKTTDAVMCDLNHEVKDFPLDLNQVADQFEQMVQEETSFPTPPKVHTSKTTNKSNRNKYYCPSCFAQVWGKPLLKVACGDCSIAFIEDV